jgi:hypothetical protein
VSWILRLYPRSWRRRYGDEVAALLEGRGFSLAIAIDLIAGAIDARLHPAATLGASAAASHDKEGTMLQKVAKFDCAALVGGTDLSRGDQWKSAGAAVGLTVVLTIVWMAVHIRIGDNPYVDSLSVMTFIVPILFSMRYTYLKKRSAGAQAIFIGGTSLAIAALMLVAGWISASL